MINNELDLTINKVIEKKITENIKFTVVFIDITSNGELNENSGNQNNSKEILYKNIKTYLPNSAEYYFQQDQCYILIQSMERETIYSLLKKGCSMFWSCNAHLKANGFKINIGIVEYPDISDRESLINEVKGASFRASKSDNGGIYLSLKEQTSTKCTLYTTEQLLSLKILAEEQKTNENLLLQEALDLLLKKYNY